MPHRAADTHPDYLHQHRSKRQFVQPSITRFFVREDRDSDESEEDERGSGPITRPLHVWPLQHQQRDSVIPSVPGSVQADLLSVGMRVRKSVPEGYKTHKNASLPSIQTTLASTTTHHAHIPPSVAATVTATEYSVKPPRDPIPETFQHQRELLPFCGLHKIGGYAEQPVTNVHLYGGSDESGARPTNLFPLPAEAFNQPFSSSHPSAVSSISSASSLRPNPANPSKRSWQDDDDKPTSLKAEFIFKIPMKVSEDEVPVSPLSESPPQHLNAFPHTALRPFAQPKTRRPASRAMDVDGMVIKEGDIEMEIENTEGRVLVGSPGDFGEADFLRPWSPGREVDMGGV